MDMSVSAPAVEVERDEQVEGAATVAPPVAPVDPNRQVKIVFASIIGAGIGLVLGLIIAVATGLLQDLC